MMPFEEEYKMHVEIEAKSVEEDIEDYARKNDYEVDIFFEDVVTLIRRQLKRKHFYGG